MIGCSDERGGAGPRNGDVPPTDPGLGEDAPINLAYLCGNRFVISNAQNVPVSVSYRVEGSEEEGRADLAAAPMADPAEAESTIETRARGTVQLFVDGRLVVARANEGIPCTPQAVGATALAEASASGQWTAPFPWPIVAIHMILLPDGRVLSM